MPNLKNLVYWLRNTKSWGKNNLNNFYFNFFFFKSAFNIFLGLTL